MGNGKTSKVAQLAGSLRGPVGGEFPGVKPGALDADLLSALDRREIEVLFQPQFSCRTGALVGAEALARWQHPSLGTNKCTRATRKLRLKQHFDLA
ncbi:MAG: EAL domain-containing protein, partial [Pseudomonadota bacterium]